MKAKRIARCFTVKKAALGTIRMEMCGAGNAAAKGLNLCNSDMIQAVKIHIFVIALVRWLPRLTIFRPAPTLYSVFSVSMC